MSEAYIHDIEEKTSLLASGEFADGLQVVVP